MHIARIPRTAAALASVAAMMCATLAACAPSGGADQSASREGTIAVGLPGSLSTLDTAHETGIINYYVAQVVSEGLLAVDKNGQLIPAIASSYHTDDAQTWVFDIRPDALFQDGNSVTIDDVLFSINIAKDPDKSPSSASYWPAGVQAAGSGDNQITITLPAPAVNFGWTVTANGGLWITEKSFYEAAASYGSSTDLIMGTGPYKAVSFQPDSKAVFTKSGTWWGGDTPAQTIEFDFFSDENARLLAHKSGQIDIATQVPTDQVSQFQGIDGVNVLTESDRSYVGLTFDQNIEPFDDIHVRKAIAHAVDRDTIVSSILKGQASVAMGIEPLDQLGSEIGEQAAADAQAGLPIDSFDLDAARAELAQSKVPGGFSAELTYPSSIPDLGSTALAIADNLKQIGVNLTVTSKPIEEWISEVGSGTAISDPRHGCPRLPRLPHRVAHHRSVPPGRRRRHPPGNRCRATQRNVGRSHHRRLVRRRRVRTRLRPRARTPLCFRTHARMVPRLRRRHRPGRHPLASHPARHRPGHRHRSHARAHHTRSRRRRTEPSLRDLRALAGCAEPPDHGHVRAGSGPADPDLRRLDPRDAVRVDGPGRGSILPARPRTAPRRLHYLQGRARRSSDCAARRARHHRRDADR